jgi:hypothetical protein
MFDKISWGEKIAVTKTQFKKKICRDMSSKVQHLHINVLGSAFL